MGRLNLMFLFLYFQDICQLVQQLNHCYAANRRVEDPLQVCDTLKPIFHWKLGSRWLPNANEINTKNMKCTWPTPEFCIGTQRNLYSTRLRLGLASGKTQILRFASGKTQILGLRQVKRKLEGSHWLQDTNMLVSQMQNSGVGGIAQHQPPAPGILRRSGI